MKTKSLKINWFMGVLALLFVACALSSVYFGVGKKAYANEQAPEQVPELTGVEWKETKHLVSADKNYLLLVTAFKAESVLSDTATEHGYIIGYEINNEEKLDGLGKKYYSGISIKTGEATPTTQSVTDIYADLTEEQGYFLNVYEMSNYNSDNDYNIRPFIKKVVASGETSYTVQAESFGVGTASRQENAINGLTVANINCEGTPAPNATATSNGAITYTYAATENGEYGEWNTVFSGPKTYWVKATVEADDNYKKATDTAFFEVTGHGAGSWVTGDTQDEKKCKCGHVIETFNKTLTSTDRQDLIVTASSNALSINGVSEYASVSSIKYGDVQIGTALNAFDFSGISDKPHGEQNVEVTVLGSDGASHTIQVPVTIITDTIDSWGKMKTIAGALTTQNQGKVHEGKYFILANDIEVGGSGYFGIRNWCEINTGFAGTLDGRGRSFNGGYMGGGGIFGSLQDATIKDVNFTNVKTNNMGSIITGNAYGSTIIENVNITINGQQAAPNANNFGVIANYNINGLTLKNVTITSTETLPYIIGRHQNNTSDKMPTCENVVINANLLQFSHDNSNPIYHKDIPGVTLNMTGGETLDTDKAIDPKAASVALECTLDGIYAQYEVESVTLNGDAQRPVDSSKYTYAATDGGKKFTIADPLELITEDDYNKNLTINVKFAAGTSSIQYNITVFVKDMSQEITVDTPHDVVLQRGSTVNSKMTFTLPADYSGYTITSVKVGDSDVVAYATDGATIPDALKNGMHGATTATLYANNGSANLTVNMPNVTIVTMEITTKEELLYHCRYHSGITTETFGAGKYYTLANDIPYIQLGDSFTYNNETLSYKSGGGLGKGFQGTLDGRNRKITIRINDGGIFGELAEGAVVKNLVIDEDFAWATHPQTSTMAKWAKGVTFENITINITNEANITSPGVVCAQHLQNSTLKNVTINATTSTIKYVLGSSVYSTGNTIDNVVVNAKSVDMATGNISIEESGITVNPTAQA